MGPLGLLLHAKEYPALCKERFPYDLGYCQVGSDVYFSQDSFDRRNILVLGGNIYELDVGEGSLLHHQMLWPGQEPLRTVMEEDLGVPLCDLTYLPGVWGDEVLVTLRGGSQDQC